ncbi:hypothetical protein KC460_00805 [Candidatus Dependentiae bacterium]|nr:hypothetical protein [Candidatus Dependentiae bacterium]
MKTQKYIKNLLFVLLISAFVIPQTRAMAQEKETFGQRAFKKVLVFGIPAAIGGIIAYNYFPKSVYSFLNPKHLYNCRVQTIPTFVGSCTANNSELPRIVNIVAPLNYLRSGLFSGIFHADNVRGATTGLVAGITGCMALRFERAGIFGYGGSDRKKIASAVRKACDNKNYREALDDLETLTGCSADYIEQSILGVTDSQNVSSVTKNQLGVGVTTVGANETLNQRIYEYIDTQSQNNSWKRRVPGLLAKTLIPSFFLSKPRSRDKIINIILCGNNYGMLNGCCSWLPKYMSYLGTSSIGLAASVVLQKKLCQSYSIKYCGYGLGIGALGYFITRNVLLYPTRKEAAEATCEVLRKKYS